MLHQSFTTFGIAAVRQLLAFHRITDTLHPREHPIAAGTELWLGSGGNSSLTSHLLVYEERNTNLLSNTVLALCERVIRLELLKNVQKKVPYGTRIRIIGGRVVQIDGISKNAAAL